MNYAPIVLFTYNRLQHTKETVAALQKNSLATESELFIYSDGAKNQTVESEVAAVRSFLKSITGFKSITIVERERNFGLADSIVDGVATIVNTYGKIIVLEDDIVTSPLFLSYMNEALTLYQDTSEVMHVSGYFFPVDTGTLPNTFFYNQTSCWGWATWARAWDRYQNDATTLLQKIVEQKRLNEFDMDGDFKFSSTLKANSTKQIKTWAIKWHASVFLAQGLCLHPKFSLVHNSGNDGSGVNSGSSSLYDTDISKTITFPIEKIPLQESKPARELAKSFLKTTRPGMIQKIIQKIWK